MKNDPLYRQSVSSPLVRFRPDTYESVSTPYKKGFGVLSSINSVDELPFIGGDATAGVENELQASVFGSCNDVDMPIYIRESNYFKNIVSEAKTGNSSAKAITNLEDFLEHNTSEVWTNSWVRFPKNRLSLYTNEVFERDLLKNKQDVFGPQRSDIGQFKFNQNGQEFVRVPISYLLKLSLAEVISGEDTDRRIADIGSRAMNHFLSDNTSPETLSFSPVPVTREEGLGNGIVNETLIRFALCQFLIQYANRRFGILEHGQRASICFAPNPPQRQRQLNELITDSFYRELFMSPCLSGWDSGEDKKDYMALCHRVLSLSQLNAVFRLKESGILTRNLVVLPNTSNISLANNGTHISLGSRKLSRLLSNPDSGFDERHEKYIGDLILKITEHFLPLFVGSYSAAPYRLDFTDFHPERVLGFLPHELDAVHLKMIWRRWKKKANLTFMGQSITPFGPEWLDRNFSRLLGLKGDFVPDFRLVDYFVSLLSTEQSPALNGKLGNDDRLKADLASMGVFDSSMSIYLLAKLRQYSAMGFSGYECRFYSQFKDLNSDMTHAVNLQLLIIALAYKYVLLDGVGHNWIPDEPFTESERRQIIFSSAIGLPTFFVRRNSRNRFLGAILKKVRKTRPSRRYDGFVRVRRQEYMSGLVQTIKKDGAGLIRELGMEETIRDLELRIQQPDQYSAAGKLTRSILDKAGADSPMKLSGHEFNAAAEQYYLHDLKNENLKDAVEVLKAGVSELDSMRSWRGGEYNQSLMSVLRGKNASDFIDSARDDLLSEQLSQKKLAQLIQLTMLVIDRNRNKFHSAYQAN